MSTQPWKTEEEMLNLGLGQRVATAIVHEEMLPDLFIEMRAEGFSEARGEDPQYRGEIFLTTGV